jgi:hypothetical protein
VSRFLAINIEGKIGQLTVRRTSSFIIIASMFTIYVFVKQKPYVAREIKI